MLAQATATSVVKTMAAALGKQSSSSKNPEELAQKACRKKGLSLPITPECMGHEGQEEIKTWYVAPQTWVEYHMATHPELLTGLGPVEDNLRSFWDVYRFGHPHHNVFSSPLQDRLQNVLPILLHGDEGRGAKKGKCLVLSIQSVLGSSPVGSSRNPQRKEDCNCREVLQKSPGLPQYGAGDEPLPYCLTEAAQQTAEQQCTNYSGATFITRWLLFGLGSWIYLKHPEVLNRMIDRVVADLCHLFTSGVKVAGKVYYAACIGIKGDLDWHRQIYELLRSYAHVGTISTGHICHACQAGGTGPMFEDYGEMPAWAVTAYTQRPWTTPPAFATIPGFPAPEELIQLDPFHIVKMGVGRSIAGGVLVYLVRHKYFDHDGSSTNFKDRLTRAHTSFRLFCSAKKKHPSLRSFTKAFLNMKTLMSAPWTATKGADTMLMIRWLAFFLKLVLGNPPPNADVQLLGIMSRLCEATSAAMQTMHVHGLWLERRCARRLYIEYMRMLRGYQLAGSRCLAFNYRAFIQKPKNHAAHHVAWSLRSQLLSGAPYVLNPEAYSCEQDEDFIGRVSRLSRKVSVRKQGSRLFERLFLKIYPVRKRWLKQCKAVA